MSKRSEAKEKKLALLTLIKQERKVLFGSFAGNKLQHTDKEEAWKRITDKAKSLGLCSNDRKWTFVRDSLFGIWKSRALVKSKRDNARRTGTGGGKDQKIDEVDLIIFEIMDKDSPVLDGLSLAESSGVIEGVIAEKPNEPCLLESSNHLNNSSNPGTSQQNNGIRERIISNPGTSQQNNGIRNRIISNPGTSQQNNGVRKRKITLSAKENSKEKKDEIHDLKKKLLEVEIYKNKLKCLKLETELNLKQSEYTKELLTGNVTMTRNSSNFHMGTKINVVSYSDSEDE